MQMNSTSTEEEYDSRKMKLQEVELAIQESREEVSKGINLVIQRGDQLEDLQDKSNNLVDSAYQFRKSARKVRRRMYCHKLKMNLLFLFIVLFILWFILSIACGFDFHKCRAKY
jgi:vesicle-associated membrane protein 7